MELPPQPDHCPTEPMRWCISLFFLTIGYTAACVDDITPSPAPATGCVDYSGMVTIDDPESYPNEALHEAVVGLPRSGTSTATWLDGEPIEVDFTLSYASDEYEVLVHPDATCPVEGRIGLHTNITTSEGILILDEEFDWSAAFHPQTSGLLVQDPSFGLAIDAPATSVPWLSVDVAQTWPDIIDDISKGRVSLRLSLGEDGAVRGELLYVERVHLGSAVTHTSTQLLSW